MTERSLEINAARRRPLLDRRVPPTPLSIDKLHSPDYVSPDSARAPSPTTTFPPPPNPGPHPPIPTTSSSPSRAASNALSRALNIASKKLFGAAPRSALPSSSPRRHQLLGVGMPRASIYEESQRDPVEDELLAALEQLAQKTDVITRWADEMYEYVKAIPQSACLPFFIVVFLLMIYVCRAVA